VASHVRDSIPSTRRQFIEENALELKKLDI